MSRPSFQAQVLQTVRDLGGQRVSREDIRQRLDLAGPGDRKRLGTAIGELAGYGHLERHADLSVSIVQVEPGEPRKHEVMWRILRAKRLVTTDNLAALAGVSRGYAQNWLEALINLGLVENLGRSRRQGGQYRLVKDPGPEAPRDQRASERSSAWRQRKMEALGKLDAAFAAVAEARLAVSRMEE
jgi:predicted transcriptional regulator